MRQFRKALLVSAMATSNACMAANQPAAPISKPAAPPTCAAGEMQYLVGKSRQVLEIMRFTSDVRIELPGRPQTMDYVASRTRIIIGSDDKIARVICG